MAIKGRNMPDHMLIIKEIIGYLFFLEKFIYFLT